MEMHKHFTRLVHLIITRLSLCAKHPEIRYIFLNKNQENCSSTNYCNTNFVLIFFNNQIFPVKIFLKRYLKNAEEKNYHLI